MEPRPYANTPVGLNFLIAGYARTEGGVATDPALPIDNTRIESNSGVLAYARAIDVYGQFQRRAVYGISCAGTELHVDRWPP